MDFLTIIAIVIIIACALAGYCRGLIKTVLSLVAVVLSILLTAVISPLIIGVVVNNDNIYDPIYEAVDDGISNSEEYKRILSEYEKYTIPDEILPDEKVEEYLNEENIKNYEVKVGEFVEQLDIPSEYKNGIIDEIEKMQGKKVKKITIDDAKGCVCKYITNIILSAIVYSVTWICITIILAIVVKIIGGVSKLPIIREVDKLAGTAMGSIIGVCVIMLLMVVVTIFSNTAFGAQTLESIYNNSILSWMYDINPIIKLIIK